MSMTLEIVAQRIDALEKQMTAVVQHIGLETDDKKTTKNKNKNKKTVKSADSGDDKPKPKRVSGYILFSKAHRDEVKAELTAALEGDDKLKNTEVMVQLAKRWRDLDESVQGEWNTKAAELKAAAE